MNWVGSRLYHWLVEDRWGVKTIGRELVKAGRNAYYENKSGNNNFNSIFDNIDQYEWDFGVVHAPNLVNAFALPGGVVRVTEL